MPPIPPDTVYTKTAKGLLELNRKLVRLPSGLRAVFLAVDGKATVADLLPCCGLSADELDRTLETLARDRYIEVAAERAQLALGFGESGSLDFTPSATPLPDIPTHGEGTPPELDTAERARQLTARVDAERRVRETAERDTRRALHGSDSAQTAPGGTAVPQTPPAQTEPVDADDATTLSQYAPTALERAMAKLSAEGSAPGQGTSQRTGLEETPRRHDSDRIEPVLHRAQKLEASLGSRSDREALLTDSAGIQRKAEAAQLARAAESAHRRRAQEDSRRRTQRARAKNRARFGWTLGLTFAALPAAVALFLQFAPLNMYRADAETVLSLRVGEPVAVGSFSYVLLPTPRIVLENLALRRKDGVTAERLEAPIGPLAALRGPTHFAIVKLSGLEIDGGAVGAIPDWAGSRPGAAIEVDQLRLQRAKFKLAGADLAPFDGDIEFRSDGGVKEAVLTNANAVVEFKPDPKGLTVVVTARDWHIPYGPPVDFSQLVLRARIAPRHRAAGEFNGKAGGGAVQGAFTAEWDAAVTVDGRFRIEHARIHDLAPGFTSSFAPRGILQASGRFGMKAPDWPALSASSRVDATFSLARGELANIDLVRAIQSPGTGVLRGGRTVFDKLTGAFQSTQGQYNYRDLQLVSGPLIASGSVAVAANGQLSGRINAEVGTKAGVAARSALTVSGTVDDPRLKR